MIWKSPLDLSLFFFVKIEWQKVKSFRLFLTIFGPVTYADFLAEEPRCDLQPPSRVLHLCPFTKIEWLINGVTAVGSTARAES